MRDGYRYTDGRMMRWRDTLKTDAATTAKIMTTMLLMTQISGQPASAADTQFDGTFCKYDISAGRMITIEIDRPVPRRACGN